MLAFTENFSRDGRLWRQNNGVFFDHRGNPIKIGLGGMCDLSGIFSRGRRLEIEVKDELRPHRDKEVIARQLAWAEMIRAHGGIAIKVQTPEEMVELLRRELE